MGVGVRGVGESNGKDTESVALGAPFFWISEHALIDICSLYEDIDKHILGGLLEAKLCLKREEGEGLSFKVEDLWLILKF